MPREDILWLLPAVLVAFYQIKFIWAKLPSPDERDTEVAGSYDELDRLRLSYLTYLTCAIFVMQLFHIFWPISQQPGVILVLRVVGYLLVAAGFLIASLALKLLGNHWTGMDNYRIKKNQQLITVGIYRLTRHPIYAAVLLEIAGFELIANSWLLAILITTGVIFFYRHIIKEEKLLKAKFTKKYLSYRRKTKMLIPYLV